VIDLCENMVLKEDIVIISEYNEDLPKKGSISICWHCVDWDRHGEEKDGEYLRDYGIVYWERW
tara:strand:- start:534 stop:722 length:189 start_codon:yes stop_codon:yes gene_type:complete